MSVFGGEWLVADKEPNYWAAGRAESAISAFLEMVVSEITMARLNNSNVLSHFSHSGIDDMADNTCHFGLNNMFADNGLSDGYATHLYFPADPLQMKACLETIFFNPGLRFVFSTRSKVPTILNSDGQDYFGGNYKFVSGKDEIIREGTQGYIVSFGETLYRAVGRGGASKTGRHRCRFDQQTYLECH